VRRAYLIEWLDHADLGNEGAWQKADDLDTSAARVVSIGWLVRQTKETVVIAHSVGVGGDRDVAGPMLIVRSAIVRMEPITLPPKPRARKCAA